MERTFRIIKNEVHDISGIKNPEEWLFKQTNGVWYPSQKIVEWEKKMESINEALNLKESYCASYDGNGDDRIFFRDQTEDSIMVHAPTMGREKYQAMEKDLQRTFFKNDDYEIYAWNDISGFDYWNKDDEHNYIMITVAIDNPDEIDIDELYNELDKCWAHYSNLYNTGFIPSEDDF